MKIKKIATLLVLVTLAMSLFVAMPASAATNYLSVWNDDNSFGMENATHTDNHLSYNSSLKASLSYTKEAARSGEQGLAVTTTQVMDVNAAITYGGIQNLTVGETYVFSAWVKIPKAFTGENNGFRVFVQDGNDKVYIAPVNDTKGEWKKVSAERKVNNTSVTFQLAFVCATNPIPENTTFYIDDLSIELKSELDMDAAKGFSSVDKYCESGNYLYYDSLAVDNKKWASGYDAWASWPTEGDFAGCMQVTVPSVADGGTYSMAQPYVSNPATLEYGKTYEASVWVYIPETYNHIGFVALEAEGKKSAPRVYYTSVYYTPEVCGKWRRISVDFSPAEANAGEMTAIRIKVYTTAKQEAKVYFADLVLVEKTKQSPVLQILKPQYKYNSTTEYVYFDVKKPGSGAFVVQYDVHSVAAASTGNTLISAIYKETNGVKQLVEFSFASFDSDDSKVSVNMKGVESPDSTYTLRTMLWNSLADMQSLKYTDSMKLN